MRILRLVLIGSLVMTAVVAVGTLVFSTFDETAGKILGTSAAVAGYSLLVMGGAAGAGPERPAPVRIVALVSIIASVAAFAFISVILWADQSWRHEGVVKAWAHCTICAIAFAVVALLGRLPLPARFGWTRVATDFLVIVFAVLADLLWVVLHEDSGAWNRAAGVVGVLAALGILTVPLLAWHERREARARLEGTRAHATCPKCGHVFDPGAEPEALRPTA